MKHISILNSPWGNKSSCASALKRLNLNYSIKTAKEALSSSDVLILPGVGNFKYAYNYLLDSYELESICRFVEKGGKIIGICLGMQLLFTHSDEGDSPGINLIAGKVIMLGESNKQVTNIGWNNTFSTTENLNCKYYHTHSYHCVPFDRSIVSHESEFKGTKIVSGVKKDNIIGFQFHPEISSKNGLSLLKDAILL